MPAMSLLMPPPGLCRVIRRLVLEGATQETSRGSPLRRHLDADEVRRLMAEGLSIREIAGGFTPDSERSIAPPGGRNLIQN